jgi:hypothetical protein
MSGSLSDLAAFLLCAISVFGWMRSVPPRGSGGVRSLKLNHHQTDCAPTRYRELVLTASNFHSRKVSSSLRRVSLFTQKAKAVQQKPGWTNAELPS